MSFGTCSVVELEPQDDLASLRHRLSWLDSGRVALVLPWDMHFLSYGLEFDLLRREAERRQLEVAIISADPERRMLARGCGFPAFAAVDGAKEAKVWRSQSLEQVEPPPRHWWDDDVALQPRPMRPRARWLGWIRFGIHFVVFILVLAILAGSAYTVVPSGVITLIPAGREFSTIVPVSVAPDVEVVDHAIRTIPARQIGANVAGYAEIETTGTMSIVAGRATGVVLFTNLLVQNYSVPAGTVVRTSSTSYPIRFRTTAAVVVPAGGQATAPIEALQEGIGNVGAFQINRVEGVVASAVRVINPNPTSGADAKDARVVIQADYDRVRRQLMRQLLDQAYTGALSELLEPTEMLLRQSLRVEAVPKESYNRFVTEQADTVGLEMQLLVSGLAVDVDNAEAVAYVNLSRRLPPGYALVDAHFELGEMAEEDIGPGRFTFFVAARGYAAVGLDTDTAVDLVRGQPIAYARERLVSEFPLAQDPQIVLWPEWPERLEWLERLPFLPLRIRVRVLPQGEEAEQDMVEIDGDTALDSVTSP
ncbi:MAG: hypothetical protein GY832_22635 [Chloroflexi bacterium]|nr:hypothetical protein [Chloroflexota bacterium]